MLTQRFFVAPQAVGQDIVELNGTQAHQMLAVLRMRLGDHCFVLDNTGWQYDVELIELSPGAARAKICSRKLVTTEPRTKITIYQGILKADRFEFVLQKGTELGAIAFVPTICDRCVVGAVSSGRSAKLDRWERIIVEAAEQCGRGRLPALQPAMLFTQACEAARGISFIPWEEEESEHLRDALRRVTRSSKSQERPSAERLPADQPASRARPFSVNIFIGPEGGFATTEVALARSFGIVPVTLGDRILRAETAALAAATAVLYEMGDLG